MASTTAYPWPLPNGAHNDTATETTGLGQQAVPNTPRGEHYRPPPTNGGDRLANFLGWFSIGLGVAQITAPGRLARLMGIQDTPRVRSTMRAIGAREITSGVGILSKPESPQWLWSRVAGDAMDVALLAAVMTSEETERRRTMAATAAVLGISLLDVMSARQHARQQHGTTEGGEARRHVRHVRKSVTVQRPREDVYTFWRNLANLPRFMRHLESVRVIDDRRSRWKAKAPVGQTVEWDAEIVADVPNEMITWRSLPGADVYNAGMVLFRSAPHGRGTEVTVEFDYDPPGGAIGATLAKLFREEPQQQVADDLRQFKQVMEVGEVLVSDATLRRGPRSARPHGDENRLRNAERGTSAMATGRRGTGTRSSMTDGADTTSFGHDNSVEAR